jgi:hypothetical protein
MINPPIPTLASVRTRKRLERLERVMHFNGRWS